MSSPSATGTPTPTQGFFERHYFLIRRLHSLSGIAPIGLFLIVHLLTNSTIVWGEWVAKPPVTWDASVPFDGGVYLFQEEVSWIHHLPFLFLIELFGLWLPIAFHAGLGVYFAAQGRYNTDRYPYQGNFRYALQRTTGYIGVLFIFMHIASLRWGWTFGGLMPTFDSEFAASSLAVHMQDGVAGWLVPGFYLFCVLALVFHFTNGLWTAAITWGLTLTEKAQYRWGRVCDGLALILAIATIMSVWGFATLSPEEALRVEAEMNGGTVVFVEEVEGVSIEPVEVEAP